MPYVKTERNSFMGRLSLAVKDSRRRLEPWRKTLSEILSQYVGYNYGENAAEKEVPVNLIEMAISILGRQLAANAPRALISSSKSRHKQAAEKLELATNSLVSREINLGRTIYINVIDALCAIGINKTGLNSSARLEIGGFLHDVGQPFSDPVCFDDWVHDMTARRYEEVQFAGNRYRLPLETLDCDLYDKKVVKGLTPTRRFKENEGGQRRVEDLGKGEAADIGEYEDHVELYDLWMPREGLFLTCPVSADGSIGLKPVREVEWQGPENGPYRLLCFSDVPNHIMPSAPGHHWLELHKIVNGIYRKLKRQVERQKTGTGFRAGSEQDARRVRDFMDGEIFQMNDPGNVREFSFGGPDQMTLAFAIHAMQQFSYLAGNLDILGGLSAQSPTATQDTMLSQNASMRIASMQDRVVQFTETVIRDLAWYLWYDPLINLPLTKRLPGTEIDIEISFGPKDREGDFLDYEISIEPYSMVHRSPGMRLQTIISLFREFILPMSPMIQQQGMTVNFEGLLRTIAEYSDMHELEDLIVFSNVPAEQRAQQQDLRQAPVTRRINERVNRSAATRQGRDQVLMQALMGRQSQPSEQAKFSMPLG